VIVVVPMAGSGTRLTHEFGVPKPFIPVAGKPMLSWAFQSLTGVPFTRVVFIALASHSRIHGLSVLAESLAPSRAALIELDDVTDGQLRTVLAAKALLDTDEDMLIASADTLVQSGIGHDIRTRSADCRGLISVARLEGDQWSFAEVDERGRAIRVAEKERISDLASTGLYYFTSGREFLDTADALIASGRKTRGEYYVMPVYQQYIDAGKFVGISEASAVWDMGTPKALRLFEQHVAGQRPS
jgi:dTDP-glucose pyrophosphorylase